MTKKYKDIQQAPRSICIVRLSALGDALMIVPLIRTLQAYLPEISLTWVISRPAYDLVEGMDGVEFIVIDKPSTIADYWRFKKRVHGRSFDVLLAAQASLRANLLYPLINAARKIGYDKLRAKDGHGFFVRETISPGNEHTLDGFLKFASALGVEEKIIRWDLPIAIEDQQWALDQLSHTARPLVLVNPAASKPERSWSVEHYIEVIKHLQNTWQAQVILTGGPMAYDKSLGDAIEGSVKVLNLIGKTTPKRLLALIDKACLLLCPDTGPSHMAAAMGTPVVALHAVTSAEVSGPYTYRHLAVDYYGEAVISILKKSPETNVWGTHAHGRHTMQLIPLNEVIDRVDSVLRSIFQSD